MTLSRLSVLLTTLLFIGLASPVPVASAQVVSEYEAKAAFLYTFVKFVEWPSGPFGSDKEPIRICILGQDPFDGWLENFAKGKEIGGRPLAVSLVSEVLAAANCQMLFVPGSESKRFRRMSAALAQKPVLTIGELDGFLSDGGLVNLQVENGRIRFDISLRATEGAKLRISSKLLSLARAVR